MASFDPENYKKKIINLATKSLEIHLQNTCHSSFKGQLNLVNFYSSLTSV